MRMPKPAPMAVVLDIFIGGLSFAAASQEAVDLGVVHRIKGEAFARSEVMEHLRYLTDVHGPRLTGSPQFEGAATWAVERLSSYGVANAHIERWGPFGRIWAIEQCSAEMIAPSYMRLTAMPLAWSGSTAGPVTGEVLMTQLAVHIIRGCIMHVG